MTRSSPKSRGLARVLGRVGCRLFSLLALVFLAGGECAAAVAENSVRIRSIRWLEDAERPAPISDEALVKLADAPGRELVRMNQAPYAPFRPTWFAVRLDRGAADPTSVLLGISALQRREIDAWLVVGGRVVARAAGGYARVSPGEAIAQGDFGLPLAAWTGGEATVLVRCVTTEPLPFQLGFVAAEDARVAAAVRAGFIFFFVGFAVVFVGFQVLLFGSLRDRAAAYYSLFCACMTSIHVVRTGYLSFDLAPGASQLFAGDLTLYLRLTSPVLGLLMLEYFTGLREWSEGLWRWNRRIVTAIPAVGITAHLVGVAAFHTVVSAIMLPASLWSLWLIVLAARQRRRGTGLVLVGWLGLLATILFLNLTILGLISEGPLLPFVPPIGLLWEMLFNGAALFHRFNALREQRHRADLRQAEVHGLARLVRVVCHDVSNPLMVIQFALERLKRQVLAGATPADLADSLRKAEGGSAAIAGVIADVRALEVLRESGGRLAVEETDLAGRTREALTLFRERAAEKGLTISENLPASAKGFAAPGILVRSVFANLLSNAVKFSPAGEAILIELVRSPERIGVRISDAGPGMPADTLAALEQATKVDSRPGTAGERGTGFGLALARDFTAAMGGSLRIEPRSSHAGSGGSGTSVTVWLKEA